MIEGDCKSSEVSNEGIVLPKVVGNIEFSDVGFAYPSRSNMVFKDLSFSVVAGKRVAVVGPSGSGKSTIISLIQRFYDPTAGIKSYPCSHFISYVCFLLGGKHCEKCLQQKTVQSYPQKNGAE